MTRPVPLLDHMELANMRGVALPVIPKRFFDFANLANGQQEVILADRIPLIEWRELTLLVRVHSHTLTGTNTIAINVYPQSWTAEEPGLQFLTGSAAAQTTIGTATPSPGVVALTVPTLGSNAIVGMARVTATATRTGAGTMQASLSLEFDNKVT
jgi:hypothetical protein